MSVVIVGGNERMYQQYREICRSFGYKAKVFAKMPADFKKKIGTPDLMVLFTNTVSHKLVCSAVQQASRCDACVIRCHSSSSSALKQLLSQHCAGCSQREACACQAQHSTLC
ncbi:DUF2325 domain-containing protein [Bacilliculturomica massiliensis]|uniref:DUF2325 domain-containing protein n=1 Tax=Bacilliculturomica massiliensis TaxID=1917867 RepID=UPI0010320B12|nr:DUF2325 domain-containing protein [Bacilliculturomica massiliensis]